MTRHWRYSVLHQALPSQASEAMHFCGYDQFRWVPPLMPADAGAVARNREMGTYLAVMAAAGVAFPLSALGYTLLAARHLFCSIINFTNHDYLFVLISALMTVSGAGATLSVDAVCMWALGFRRAGGGGERRGGERRGSRVVHVLLRFQLAVVYLFAALWKRHPDWLGGLCTRSIFLLLEEQRAARGVPWAALERLYPSVFVVVGLGGLALDAAMFAALAFLRPSGRTIPYTVTYHLLFHGFTFYAMAQRIRLPGGDDLLDAAARAGGRRGRPRRGRRYHWQWQRQR